MFSGALFMDFLLISTPIERAVSGSEANGGKSTGWLDCADIFLAAASQVFCWMICNVNAEYHINIRFPSSIPCLLLSLQDHFQWRKTIGFIFEREEEKIGILGNDSLHQTGSTDEYRNRQRSKTDNLVWRKRKRWWKQLEKKSKENLDVNGERGRRSERGRWRKRGRGEWRGDGQCG